MKTQNKYKSYILQAQRSSQLTE